MPLDGVVTVAFVLAAGIAAGAAALWIARALGLHTRLLVTADPSLATIERMAELADAARAEGLLMAEGRVDKSREPILALGLALAVEGIDAGALRERLDHAIDDSAGGPRVGRTPWPTLLTAVGASLVLAVVLMNGPNPSATNPAFAVLAVLGFFACSTLVALIPPRAAASARLMSAMLQASAAVLIRSGHDGAAVRRALLGMLPQAAETPDVRAKAA